ncbi:cell division ATP-binding protein FtsE [Desulfacinum hydrothermale DSM 13146]|uniref:Cell division ATP-binding protein FtsE n=1 Tax=Desulfacinum hydrothermale DSM 13146 TaxID=1121390 RepID=A0A1W1XLX3_9BACT|nr:ATP-binding cassette domain-containing protein [Desulfacinum hydrothermale]SMC24854.1 cell division ATP-binding protein FtsE [Desulfacinum hydrothermale DSM 13146]
MTSVPFIQCFHVAKSYVAGEEVLRDANLQVFKGEFLFLMGPSGAGKSTFLKLLLGLEAPTRGHILVDGRNIHRLSRKEIPAYRRKVGMVFQDFRLLNQDSVFHNVALPLVAAGRSRRWIRSKVKSLLQFVGLDGKTHVPCCRLSGGEQQRVALARAVANDPWVLLADEPTGNLDACASAVIMELLKAVHARGTTVVVATHDASLLEHLPEARRVHIQGGIFYEEAEAAAPRFPSAMGGPVWE